MFFALSKVLDLAVAPLSWALVLCAAAALLSLRPGPGRARGAACAAMALLVLLVFSSPRVGNALMRSLEASAVATASPTATYDAAILLGGLIDAEASESSGAVDYNDAVERLLTSFELLRSGRARMLLISGGAMNPRIHSAIESRVLARQLAAWGIDPARLVVEDRSRNTRENAIESAAVVRARGWKRLVLVTSAFHQERAAGCFRAAGLALDTLPVDFRSQDPARFPASLLPRAESLAESTFALREFLGRAVYRARGYSK